MIPPSPEMFQNLKGVFVGSGSDGMSNPQLAAAIMSDFLFRSPQPTANDASTTSSNDLFPELQQGEEEEETATASSSSSEPIIIVYIGTATYDITSFAKRQTDCFLEYPNVQVSFCNVVDQLPSMESLRLIQDDADMIIVGGGNTLFAIDRWKQVGLLPYLEQARRRGCVLAGGSAGAICWFDGGHSDSMDPDTYKKPMLAQHFSGKEGGDAVVVADESSAMTDNNTKKEWKYIRVDGLGHLPGLVCPHFDKIQSNGVLREHDFDNMLQSRHSGELGIGIDHWAALLVNSDSYKVISLSNRIKNINGNDKDNEENEKEEPACVWIKQVQDDGTVKTTKCPTHGKLSELLRLPSKIQPDEEMMNQCRKENPDDGPKPSR